jgi:DNA-binding MltR family transcriptional regulator
MTVSAKKPIPDLFKDILRSAETLDRQTHAGLTMIVAAALDRLLEQALRTKMVNLNRDICDKIFGEYGTMRDFNSKILLAHALGIADRETFKRLTAIRRVRNLFAHTEGYLSFASPEVSALLTKELDQAAPTSADEFVVVAEAVEESVAKACSLPHPGLLARIRGEEAASFSTVLRT